MSPARWASASSRAPDGSAAPVQFTEVRGGWVAYQVAGEGPPDIGEIELRGGDVAGIGVHIAARIGAVAQPGEVLVSGPYRILYTLPVSLSVPFTEARRRLSELLDRVSRRHDHVVITRNGEPQAVLMSPDEYEALLETVEVLNDGETLRALTESERDVTAGRLVSLDEVRRRFGS